MRTKTKRNLAITGLAAGGALAAYGAVRSTFVAPLAVGAVIAGNAVMDSMTRIFKQTVKQRKAISK